LSRLIKRLRIINIEENALIIQKTNGLAGLGLGVLSQAVGASGLQTQPSAVPEPVATGTDASEFQTLRCLDPFLTTVLGWRLALDS
jgi:hypothetical protein